MPIRFSVTNYFTSECRRQFWLQLRWEVRLDRFAYGGTQRIHMSHCHVTILCYCISYNFVIVTGNNPTIMQKIFVWFLGIIPASSLYKSTAGRYRPVSYPDGPITARYRFINNAYWDTRIYCLSAQGLSYTLIVNGYSGALTVRTTLPDTDNCQHL